MTDIKQKPKKNGRPSKYNLDIDEEICTRIATGEALRTICKDSHMPHIATIMTWVFGTVEGTEAFHEHYANARRMQAELYADELNDIADNGTNDWMERNDSDNAGYAINGESIQRSRLRVDTRKWVASRLLGKYSEKSETKIEHSGTVTYKPNIKRFDGTIDESPEDE